MIDSTPFVFYFNDCSETWLSPYANLDDYVIPGYVLVTDDREFSWGGGVGLFINNEHNFQIRDNLRINAIENTVGVTLSLDPYRL